MSVPFALTRGLHIAATMLLASVTGAMLVCLAPGAGVDENALDPSLSAESRAALDAKRAAEREPFRFVPRYLAGLIRGELGLSHAFNRPVATLLGERWRVTAIAMSEGLGGAWLLGLALAGLTAAGGTGSGALLGLRAAVHGASGLMVSAPVALIALLLAAASLPAGVGIGLAVFPTIYTVSESLLREARGRPWVTAARARGASEWRIFASHVMLPSMRPLAALAAATVPVALGSSVPLEALGGHAGLGQLAWRATLARDVNLLVGMTLVITAVTLGANLCAEIATGGSKNPADREEAA